MRRVIDLVALFAVVILLGGSVAGATGYSISATPEIELPSKTVEFAGTEYTIDSITRTTADEGLSISTDVPANTSYYIQLRNPDNKIISRSLKSGDADHDISNFGAGEAGSYSVVIERNGIKAVHPVVIPGYTLSITVPSKTEQGKEIPVTATITERQVNKHSELDYVEVIAGDSDTMVRQTLSKESGNEYTANMSTSDFEADTYNLSVVVRGESKVRGRNEIVGIGDSQVINITEPTTRTPTATSTPDDNGDTGSTGANGGGIAGGGVGTDPTETANQNDTSTVTPSPGNNSTQTVSATETLVTPSQQTTTQTASTESPQQSPEAGTSQPETSSTASTPAVTTNDEILQPATSGKTTTDGTGPGFTIGLSVFAGILTLYLGMRSPHE